MEKMLSIRKGFSQLIDYYLMSKYTVQYLIAKFFKCLVVQPIVLKPNIINMPCFKTVDL